MKTSTLISYAALLAVATVPIALAAHIPTVDPGTRGGGGGGDTRVGGAGGLSGNGNPPATPLDQGKNGGKGNKGDTVVDPKTGLPVTTYPPGKNGKHKPKRSNVLSGNGLGGDAGSGGGSNSGTLPGAGDNLSNSGDVISDATLFERAASQKGNGAGLTDAAQKLAASVTSSASSKDSASWKELYQIIFNASRTARKHKIPQDSSLTAALEALLQAFGGISDSFATKCAREIQKILNKQATGSSSGGSSGISGIGNGKGGESSEQLSAENTNLDGSPAPQEKEPKDKKHIQTPPASNMPLSHNPNVPLTGKPRKIGNVVMDHKVGETAERPVKDTTSGTESGKNGNSETNGNDDTKGGSTKLQGKGSEGSGSGVNGNGVNGNGVNGNGGNGNGGNGNGHNGSGGDGSGGTGSRKNGKGGNGNGGDGSGGDGSGGDGSGIPPKKTEPIIN